MIVKKMRGEILTKRPEGMDYETYREKRKAQQRLLKNRLRFGYMVWPSKGIPMQKGPDGKILPVQSKGTLVGPVPELQFVD